MSTDAISLYRSRYSFVHFHDYGHVRYVLVTQPTLNGPLSCFDLNRRGHRRRALEVDVSHDDSGSEAGGGGYLASAVTDRTGAGSSECPWLLRASPWQRINVTLIDFSDSAAQDVDTETFGYSIVLGETADTAGTEHTAGLNLEERHPAVDVDRHRPGGHRHDEPSDRDDQRQQHTDTDGNKLHELHLRTFCHKYAVVREHQPTNSRETVVCGDKARRKVVYLSAGNEIEVELIRAASTDDDDPDDKTSARQPAVFLLRYDSQFTTVDCP